MIRGIADNLLPVARKQIKEVSKQKRYEAMFEVDKEDKEKFKIKGIYESYTAAFGMVVNQSGFQSAFAIYNEKGTNSDGDKKLITNLLYDMLRDMDFVRGYNQVIDENDYDLCKENIFNAQHNHDQYELFFKEASIALKRAIRTFEIVKK
ncbi:hypothetical protein AGMMS50239_16010 [Bacteroidia bacterium]|nr:hypothetical protein AGMMS50239_16010 [Bacteroidia bacterium]